MTRGLPYRIVIGATIIYVGLLILIDMLAPSIGVAMPASIQNGLSGIGLPFLFLNNIVFFSFMLHRSRQIKFAVNQMQYTLGLPFVVGLFCALGLPIFVKNDVITFAFLAVVVTMTTWLSVGAFADSSARDRHSRGAKLGWHKGTQNEVDQNALTVGGVPISWQSEVQHVLITGSTGTGKTQVMDSFLRTIRARGDKAVIIDPGGSFYSRHYAGEGDKLANPLDDRSMKWGPFAEIETDYDFERVAAAMVPDASGESQQWHVYGRTFLANVMRAMHGRKQSSPRQLFDWLMVAKADRLSELLEGTASAILCEPENAKMLGSVRGVLTPYTGILKQLEETPEPWSVRRWMRSESKGGNDQQSDWLFITYRDDQMGLLRQFVATVADLALLEALSLPEDSQRRLFFFLDEIDSLGRIGQLKDGLIKLRKFGGACVLAVQTIAQLRSVYGPDISRALMGNTATKVILRPGDAETAKAMEAEIGEHEIERQMTSTARASGSSAAGLKINSQSSTTTTQSTQIVRQSAVMASELQGMPNLRGVLIRPGEGHTVVDVPYVEMPRRTEPYRAKALEPV